MKYITMIIILIGLMNYGTIYSSSPTPAHGFDYPSLAIHQPSLFSDPDDDEDENRVRSRIKSPTQNRRIEN